MRKIIHIDMDCFYAAIEIRDNPSLANKPVAVGGPTEARSVLCTCNYPARKFGVHSAMPTAQARRLCPDLIVLPINMPKYREAAHSIRKIFKEFTDLVEPLSLDEAYLDVTHCTDYQGSATLIATEIRKRIWDSLQLTASAGVAPNKFLAKIASGWNKPNGIWVIKPQQIAPFIAALPVQKIYGVGKVTAKKLQQLGLITCADLQKLSLAELTYQFGKLGQRLFTQCRGVDHRPVEPNKIRKSLSVERTFSHDIDSIDDCLANLAQLYSMLTTRIQSAAAEQPIKNQYIKIKYQDFSLTTLERASHEANFLAYQQLLMDILQRKQNKIRLMGLGVHFRGQDDGSISQQQQRFPLE